MSCVRCWRRVKMGSGMDTAPSGNSVMVEIVTGLIALYIGLDFFMLFSICCFLAIVHAARMHQQCKPEYRYLGYPGLLRPSTLTAEGRRSRLYYFLFLFGMFACLGVCRLAIDLGK